MPERILSPSDPMEAIHAISQVLFSMRDNLAHIDTATAVQAEKSTQMVKHLETLNGRVAKSEDRTALLEMAIIEIKTLPAKIAEIDARIKTLEGIASESRGAWKLAAAIASIPASIIAAAAVWISQHAK